MIYLKKLSLKNFQRHSHLDLDFNDGVNVLYGSSDAGKSCVRRAIEFLCDFNICDGIRKTGTKKTEVRGEFSNGVVLTRIRSSSINRYILEKDGKETQFDSIGKTAPQEILDALEISPLEINDKKYYLNSYPQISLPFLFDISPSERARIFNKLTGNDILDVLFGQFNKDILRIKRGHKEEVEKFEERAELLEKKEIEKEKAEAVYTRVKKRLKTCQKLYEKYSNLLELKELVKSNLVTKNETVKTLKQFKVPQDTDIKQLREKIERLSALLDVKNGCEKLSTGLDRVRGQLKAIRVPDVDSVGLTTKIKRFDTLKSLKRELDNTEKMCYTLNKNIKINDKDLSLLADNHTHLLKEMKVCPICKREMTDECIKEIKL